MNGTPSRWPLVASGTCPSELDPSTLAGSDGYRKDGRRDDDPRINRIPRFSDDAAPVGSWNIVPNWLWGLAAACFVAAAAFWLWWLVDS